MADRCYGEYSLKYTICNLQKIFGGLWRLFNNLIMYLMRLKAKEEKYFFSPKTMTNFTLAIGLFFAEKSFKLT